MNNKRSGNKFEVELCQLLYTHGFWAHNMAQNAAGQPFDILAAKNGKAIPIDCKVCEKNVFSFRRVEENQRGAMELWKARGNADGLFALKLSNDAIYMLSYRTILELEATNCKQLVEGAYPEISLWATPFEQWVETWS